MKHIVMVFKNALILDNIDVMFPITSSTVVFGNNIYLA